MPICLQSAQPKRRRRRLRQRSGRPRLSTMKWSGTTICPAINSSASPPARARAPACLLLDPCSSTLAPRSSLLTPQSTRVSVCRLGCPLRMKDLVKRTNGRENGKVVGLPTITDSLGFSDQKKDCAWVRWEGGGVPEWVPWNELAAIRRSPVRAKRPVQGCFRPGHSPSSSKKRSFMQPTLFSHKGRRAAWKVVLYPATPRCPTPPAPFLFSMVSLTVELGGCS